jgi:membrane protein DedA with SNARE-associated domain
MYKLLFKMNLMTISAGVTSAQFQDYFHRFGYIGIYIYFVTADQLSPIPEEFSLIIIGYLASHGLINPILAGVISLVAFFTIDVIYFYLTKSGSKLISGITKKANSPGMSRYKEELKKNTPRALLILSFVPRVRLLSPVFAALAELKFIKFMIYNGLGLALFNTVYIAIGIIFHKSLSKLLPKIGMYRHVIFIVAVIVLIALSFFIYRKISSQKTGETETRPQ